MNLLLKLTIYTITKMVGPERIKKTISAFANYSGLDLLFIAYNNLGILKFENHIISGEHFLVTKVLKKNLGIITRPVIFDVGANVGNYSIILKKEFHQAHIYAFEPNEKTFEQLKTNVENSSTIKCINAGLGTEEKTETIYTYSDDLLSSHASIYDDVFRTFHKRSDIVEIEFQMTTLDLFCEREKIQCIDFLKIDTEGNELNVLKGATKMLSEGNIKIIQFEFGECDVFSRVFLKDFYTILFDYNIYRLDTDRLIPLFEYNVINEIFHFQNFIAVRKDFPFQDELQNLPWQ
ncbi:FkbM family methyltransferase [Thermodesulfobacteriota bacterium]